MSAPPAVVVRARAFPFPRWTMHRAITCTHPRPPPPPPPPPSYCCRPRPQSPMPLRRRRPPASPAFPWALLRAAPRRRAQRCTQHHIHTDARCPSAHRRQFLIHSLHDGYTLTPRLIYFDATMDILFGSFSVVAACGVFLGATSVVNRVHSISVGRLPLIMVIPMGRCCGTHVLIEGDHRQ